MWFVFVDYHSERLEINTMSYRSLNTHCHIYLERRTKIKIVIQNNTSIFNGYESWGTCQTSVGSYVSHVKLNTQSFYLPYCPGSFYLNIYLVLIILRTKRTYILPENAIYTHPYTFHLWKLLNAFLLMTHPCRIYKWILKINGESLIYTPGEVKCIPLYLSFLKNSYLTAFLSTRNGFQKNTYRHP